MFRPLLVTALLILVSYGSCDDETKTCTITGLQPGTTYQVEYRLDGIDKGSTKVFTASPQGVVTVPFCASISYYREVR